MGWFAVIATPEAFSAPSTPVSPGHFVYGLYDQLKGYGCLRSVPTILQPQTYDDLRAGIFLPDGSTCTAPEWLLQKTYFLKSPRLANQLRFRMWMLPQDSVSLRGTQGQVVGLFPFQQGRPVGDGGNFLLEANLAAMGGGNPWGFSVGMTPGVVLGWWQYQNWQADAYLQEGFVGVNYGQVELSYGRNALQFGNTFHGSLLYSPAARAVDRVRLGLRPLAMGGWGTFRGEIWYAPNQGKGLAVPNAELLGVGIDWLLNSWLEVGVVHLHQFGGSGAPPVGLGDLAKMLFYASSPSLANKAIALHVDAWLPSFVAKVYGQVLLSGPSEASFLVGAFAPRLGDATLRLEIVKTARRAYEDGFWTQGLVYENTPLGHPLGQDAFGVYVDLGVALQKQWEAMVGVFTETRLLNPTAPLETEKRIGGEAGLRRRWGKWEVEGSARYARVTNHLNTSGSDVDLFGIGGAVRYTLY